MDCCLSYTNPKFPTVQSGALRFTVPFRLRIDRRPLIVVASTNRTNRCEFSGLHAPLEPRTPAGRCLSGVLLDDRDSFLVEARKELERLAHEREECAARLRLRLSSDEACLHRRIAEFKEQECRNVVEDVMYMLILHKFSEMRVHLVPKLSKCVYNGRLEIWPSKNWELESIHSFEVLPMVKEHLTAVIGCRANPNATENWATTEIQLHRLCQLYCASVLYGYFLKSASLRRHLESGLELNNGNQLDKSSMRSMCHMGSPKSRYYVNQLSHENLRSYLMGFDQETIQMCAKPQSKEAMDLMERHNSALFGDEETDLHNIQNVITTSVGSLKRLALEAVAFGSFLWDAENCVSAVYMLKENSI